MAVAVGGTATEVGLSHPELNAVFFTPLNTCLSASRANTADIVASLSAAVFDGTFNRTESSPVFPLHGVEATMRLAEGHSIADIPILANFGEPHSSALLTILSASLDMSSRFHHREFASEEAKLEHLRANGQLEKLMTSRINLEMQLDIPEKCSLRLSSVMSASVHPNIPIIANVTQFKKASAEHDWMDIKAASVTDIAPYFPELNIVEKAAEAASFDAPRIPSYNVNSFSIHFQISSNSVGDINLSICPPSTAAIQVLPSCSDRLRPITFEGPLISFSASCFAPRQPRFVTASCSMSLVRPILASDEEYNPRWPAASDLITVAELRLMSEGIHLRRPAVDFILSTSAHQHDALQTSPLGGHASNSRITLPLVDAANHTLLGFILSAIDPLLLFGWEEVHVEMGLKATASSALTPRSLIVHCGTDDYAPKLTIIKDKVFLFLSSLMIRIDFNGEEEEKSTVRVELEASMSIKKSEVEGGDGEDEEEEEEEEYYGSGDERMEFWGSESDYRTQMRCVESFTFAELLAVPSPLRLFNTLKNVVEDEEEQMHVRRHSKVLWMGPQLIIPPKEEGQLGTAVPHDAKPTIELTLSESSLRFKWRATGEEDATEQERLFEDLEIRNQFIEL